MLRQVCAEALGPVFTLFSHSPQNRNSDAALYSAFVWARFGMLISIPLRDLLHFFDAFGRLGQISGAFGVPLLESLASLKQLELKNEPKALEKVNFGYLLD